MLYASLSVSVAQQIQYPEPILNPESCTSIMVGKKASADGSVMTSHTCDSNYRTWMDIVPSASYDHDTTTTVYTGRMHTEYAEGTRGMIAKGTLPEARSTYQFLNTAYPCLNEKQLGIGETTITGRKALVNKKGMFMIEELQRIALQRCTTACDAIRLMDDTYCSYTKGNPIPLLPNNISILRSTINLNLDYFFSSILKPFLENVIRNFILDTKRLERFSMRQSLGLVLKVKPFKIFTAIHKS